MSGGNVSSYSGYYKGLYLRSSYEYCFVRLLEKTNTPYRYEEKVYYFDDGSSYSPDFHIYSEKGSLVSIVEIKSESPKQLQEAYIKVNKLRDKVDVPIHIVTSKELNKLCTRNGLDYYKIIEEWRLSDKTTPNQVMVGKNNPMYNRKHSEESKRKNGQKTKERFKDKDFRDRHSRAVRQAMMKVDKDVLRKGKVKPREQRVCPECGEKFTVIVSSDKVYCSVPCGSRAMFRLASEQKKAKNAKRSEKIKQELYDLAEANRDIILETPYNKVSTCLRPLLDEILNKYGFKDDRNIFFALYGKYSNSYKRLLKDLKNHVE